jgi:hypothetical protein
MDGPYKISTWLPVSGEVYAEMTGCDTSHIDNESSACFNENMSNKVNRARQLLYELKYEHPVGSPAEIAHAESLVWLIEQQELIVRRLPKTEPPEGSIVEFQRRFVQGRTVYTYVGTRRRNRWYVTGRMFKGDCLSWREFVTKLQDMDPKLFVDFKVVRHGEDPPTYPYADGFES